MRLQWTGFIVTGLLAGIDATGASIAPAHPLFSIRDGSPSPFLPTDILGSNLIGQIGVVIPGGVGGLGLQAGDDVDAIA
jgi:hypothetical protein